MGTSKKLRKSLSILLLFLMSFMFVGCDEASEGVEVETPSISDIKDKEEGKKEPVVEEKKEVIPDAKVEVTGNLEVHYIDVRQGDAILIKQGKSSMLIDAGDNKYGQTVVSYLKKNNVSHLDYVIGTHPHADHIGGLDDVINTFSIGKIIMPKVTHTTKTFEDVVMAIKNKGLKITTPVVGTSYDLGEGKFTILAPNRSSYHDLNDYSVMAKLVYGNNSFIFTGDAEATSEGETVANGQNLKADVLKVGHHGSDTSTTSKFLDAVDPKYAVIQVGGENKYGHPTQGTLQKLKNKNIEVYRNDLSGNIIASSDGNKITFNTKPSEFEAPVASSAVVAPKAPVAPTVASPEMSGQKYIGNKNSNILHRPDCSSLPKESNRVYFDSKDEGVNSGYRGCKRCNP